MVLMLRESFSDNHYTSSSRLTPPSPLDTAPHSLDMDRYGVASINAFNHLHVCSHLHNLGVPSPSLDMALLLLSQDTVPLLLSPGTVLPSPDMVPLSPDTVLLLLSPGTEHHSPGTEHHSQDTVLLLLNPDMALLLLNLDTALPPHSQDTARLIERYYVIQGQ